MSRVMVQLKAEGRAEVEAANARANEAEEVTAAVREQCEQDLRIKELESQVCGVVSGFGIQRDVVVADSA